MESVVHRSAAVEAWKSGIRPFEDRVVAEEPLEIRVNGVPLAVTLRTPGEDDELAAGFVLTEGVATDSDRIERILAVADVQPSSRGNVVDVRLSETAETESRQRSRRGRRPDFITSACGMCGRGTIDAVRRRAAPLRNGQAVAPGVLCGLPERLRAQQVVFAETGGLHAAGLFDFNGNLIVAREDVGRHNAVDKVIGFAALRRQLPLSGCILLVSGRAGFEIVVKAWVAGIPVLASISAPSTLAVEVAEEADMALLGFLRDGNFTLYTGRSRIAAC